MLVAVLHGRLDASPSRAPPGSRRARSAASSWPRSQRTTPRPPTGCCARTSGSGSRPARSPAPTSARRPPSWASRMRRSDGARLVPVRWADGDDVRADRRRRGRSAHLRHRLASDRPRPAGRRVAVHLAGRVRRRRSETHSDGTGRRPSRRRMGGARWLDQVRLRLHRGQQGPEGPARRQGREPRRDDATWACPSRPASPSPPRPAGTTSSTRRRPPELAPRSTEHLTALEKADGQDARRPGRPAAGLASARGAVLHARDDGDRPQRRPQRRVGARAWPSRPATSGSPGTPTAG